MMQNLQGRYLGANSWTIHCHAAFFIPVAFPLALNQRLFRKYNEAPKGVHLLLAAHTLFE